MKKKTTEIANYYFCHIHNSLVVTLAFLLRWEGVLWLEAQKPQSSELAQCSKEMVSWDTKTRESHSSEKKPPQQSCCSSHGRLSTAEAQESEPCSFSLFLPFSSVLLFFFQWESHKAANLIKQINSRVQDMEEQIQEWLPKLPGMSRQWTVGQRAYMGYQVSRMF